jgi:cellulose synthase/poly-beta-1,6-N-acetylglucosamine synthase-like glycosyltransferase
LISTKDRRDLLRQALESIRQLDYPREKIELVVVEETGEPEDPGVDRYVVLPREGRGFAWSRNAALQAATHPLVAFTDDDCIVDRRWLRELAAPFEDQEVGAVAGAVLAQPCGLLGKTEIVLGFPGGGLRRIAWAKEQIRPVLGLSTVNAAARREILQTLGGFSESTGIYGGEDSDLFGRLTERHRAVFNPRAMVHHRARDSVGGIARWLYRRGISAIGLVRLSRPRRLRAVLGELRSSAFLRLGFVTALLYVLGWPMAMSLFVLAGVYYALMIVRFRFAWRPMGLAVLLLTPLTKVLMDAAFDVGRLKGLLLWFSGSFQNA